MRNHVYQDISHFRAPYKDSFLSGFGAFGEVDGVATRIVKVDGQDVVGIDLKAQAAKRPAGPAVIGMGLDWGQKIAPPEKDASGKIIVDSALLLPVEAAVNEKNKGNPNIDSVVGAIARFVPMGYYVVVPTEVDTTKIGKHLLIATRAALPRVANPTLGSVVIVGPPDADFGFTAAGGGKKLSVAVIAGYSAVALLVVSALAMAGKKRRL